MQDHVLEACEAVKNGGLIVYPTEGVYGIGCDPKNEQALARLLQLKNRDPDKGLILIAATFEMLSPFIKEPKGKIRKQIMQTWPGPITWILEAEHYVSPILTGNRETLAVRVSAHPFVQELCNQLGHALVSTSANVSGQPPIQSLDVLQQTFGETVDYITPLAPGDLKQPTPIFDAQSGKQLR